MRTVSLRQVDMARATIPIGYEGENEYTQVRIDCLKTFQQHPEAVPSLAVKDPAGNEYSVIVNREGDVVVWDVTANDLTTRGTGEIQIVFTIDETIIGKTATAKTVIKRSIEPQGGGGTGDYNDLENKPSIEGVTLEGDMTLSELGIAATDDVHSVPAGGTSGQYLKKLSGDDYDIGWVTGGGGGGGTSDYEDLENKPSIGGVELIGNKSLHDLGAAATSDIPDVSGFYTKPQTGIPAADLASGVIPDVSGFYTKPAGGIPASDIASGVIPDPTDIIDDTAGEGDTDKVVSADKFAEVTGELSEAIAKVTEEITATVTNAVSLSNMNGAYGLQRDSISGGVATYTPSSSPNTNPSIRDVCDLGSAYRLVSFKYKVTKTDESIGDPQRFTLILGSDEYHYFPVKYGEWVYVQIFTSVNLTRVYFMLEGYTTAPSSGVTVQVKDYYVYNIADIHGEMLFHIISKQRTNFQDGQVTYTFTTKLDSGFVNAQEHGVKGNGTDDDTDTINALFRSFNGKIYFPAGTYSLSGTIEVMGNTEVFGDGNDTVFSMDAFDSLTTMPYRSGDKTYPYILVRSDNVVIEKIKLVGNTETVKAEMHWGIGIYDADGVRVSGVTVSDINCDLTEAVNSKIGYGISGRYSNDVIIEDCNVQRCGYECIGFFDGCTHGIIRDNYTQDGKRTCIQVHRGCSSILIANNYMKQTHNKYDAGLTIHGLASTNEPIIDLRIEGNTLECTENGAQADNENAPFQIMSDSKKVNISNNHIFGGKRAMAIGTIDELVVSGNVMNCNSSSDYGLRSNGTNAIFVGNIMDNDASSGNVIYENPVMVGNIGIGS